jgi:hypothetical protein
LLDFATPARPLVASGAPTSTPSSPSPSSEPPVAALPVRVFVVLATYDAPEVLGVYVSADAAGEACEADRERRFAAEGPNDEPVMLVEFFSWPWEDDDGLPQEALGVAEAFDYQVVCVPLLASAAGRVSLSAYGDVVFGATRSGKYDVPAAGE